MGPARIYPCRKMHRSRAPSIAPGTFFVAQPWADCITNMPGFNLRQAQHVRRPGKATATRCQRRTFAQGTEDLKSRAFPLETRAAAMSERDPGCVKTRARTRCREHNSSRLHFWMRERRATSVQNDG